MCAVIVHPVRRPARLFNWNFLLLWQGQLVSQVGNQAFLVVMLFWIKETTGSASLMGLLMMLSALPALAIGPLAGTLADRHSRRLIILGADLVRGLDLLALVAIMLAWRESKLLVLPIFFAVAVFNAIVNAVFAPAVSAVIPDLVPKDRLSAANSLDQVSSRTVMFLGQAAAGTLYRILGAPMLCFVDAITFLVSTLSLTLISIPQNLAAREREPFGRLLRSYLLATREGFRYVRGRPGMWQYLLTSAALNFFFMPVFVLLPFYVEGALAARVDVYGYLMAAFAAGGLLGAAVPGSLELSGRRRGILTMTALVTTAALFAALGALRSIPAALLAMFAIGACSALVNVVVVTIFQAAAPGEIRGRVMSLLIAMSRAVSPLGMALGGVMGDLAHGNVPVIYFACGAAALATTTLATASPAFRSFMTWEACPP